MKNEKIQTFVFMKLKYDNNVTRKLSEVNLIAIKRSEYFKNAPEPHLTRELPYGQELDSSDIYREIIDFIEKQSTPICLISNLSDICNIPTVPKKNSNVITLVHQNIRGLLRKLNIIEQFLNDNNIDIFCVTEHHWVKKHQDDLFNFSNYALGSSFRRSTAEDGGSLIIVKKENKKNFKERCDIVNLSKEGKIEIACVESKKIVVVCAYLPSHEHYDSFETVMDQVLRKICILNKNVVVCGDFNINLFGHTKNIINIKNLFKSYNLNYLFLEPTRIAAGNAATCIDNIYTNILPESKQIIMRKLPTDHFGQLITFDKEDKHVDKSNVTINLKNCVDNWKMDSLRKKFPYVCTENDPNKLYQSFFKMFGSDFISNGISGLSQDNETEKHLESIHRFSLDSKIIKIKSDIFTALEHFFADITFLQNQSPSPVPAACPAEDLLKKHINVCEKQLKFNVTTEDIEKTFYYLNDAMKFSWVGSIIEPYIKTEASNIASFYNECINSGIFPDAIKLETMQPSFGSNRPSDFSRPLVIIFETIIHDQLDSYFKNNGLLVDTSTAEDKLMLLYKNIFDAWEANRDAFGIFCKFSKASDWVDHVTLVKKLQHYGIIDGTLGLLTSYLNINNDSGKKFNSIIGSLLYRFYINDLAFVINDQNIDQDQQILLHADEISLLFKLQRKKQINDYNNMVITLSNVVNWFNVNNFKLNMTNTRCIRFVSQHQFSSSVRINDTTFNAVSTVIFLDITLDCRLMWALHLTNLSNKLNAVVCMILRALQKNDIETAKTIYFNRFHSLMSYGILLWGHVHTLTNYRPAATAVGAFQTIFDLQKRAISAIYNFDGKQKNIKKKFEELNILTVSSQYIYDSIIFVKKNMANFRKYSDIHNYDTRNKDNLVIPYIRLPKLRNWYQSQCIYFFNEIPKDIRKIESFDDFKSKVKDQLCKKFYCSVNAYKADENAWD